MDIKTKQAAYHDWEATHYDDKWSISFDQRCIDYAYGRYRKAVPAATRFGDVLEIGCGTGFFLLNLAQAGVVERAFCTDISPGMVKTCMANGRRLGIDVDGRVADAESLPFQDASFDLLLGHAVLHHLPDLDAAFAEMRRVLRPHGRIVFAGEPSRTGDRIANQWKRLARTGVKLAAAIGGSERVLADRAMPPDEAGAAALEWEVDLHTFPPRQLEDLARRAGFIDVRTVTEELTANWLGWVNRTVEGMVGADRFPDRYRLALYRAWRGLFAFDERLAQSGVVPKGVFYNCILTGAVPG